MPQMEKLAQEVTALIGLRLTPQHLTAFEVYARELMDWNRRFNLTAIRAQEEIRVKHFLDSLTVSLAFRGRPVDRVIDVGTGAGFPGIPLKIVFPHIQLTLVESIGKKAEFCQHMVERLKFKDVTVLYERVERVGQMPEHREQYDWALARAVAQLSTLSEYLLPLVHVGGYMLAQKAESAQLEIQEASRALDVLGGNLRQIIPVNLPGVAEERCLVVLEKVVATPPKYPRRVGMPSKKPL
ncbi:MAG: 16S rRNA (guanine(527)-N(7))-methyltransferase RsmG [Chloroflexota bacterium]